MRGSVFMQRFSGQYVLGPIVQQKILLFVLFFITKKRRRDFVSGELFCLLLIIMLSIVVVGAFLPSLLGWIDFQTRT